MSETRARSVEVLLRLNRLEVQMLDYAQRKLGVSTRQQTIRVLLSNFSGDSTEGGKP